MIHFLTPSFDLKRLVGLTRIQLNGSPLRRDTNFQAASMPRSDALPQPFRSQITKIQMRPAFQLL